MKKPKIHVTEDGKRYIIIDKKRYMIKSDMKNDSLIKYIKLILKQILKRKKKQTRKRVYTKKSMNGNTSGATAPGAIGQSNQNQTVTSRYVPNVVELINDRINSTKAQTTSGPVVPPRTPAKVPLLGPPAKVPLLGPPVKVPALGPPGPPVKSPTTKRIGASTVTLEEIDDELSNLRKNYKDTFKNIKLDIDKMTKEEIESLLKQNEIREKKEKELEGEVIKEKKKLFKINEKWFNEIKKKDLFNIAKKIGVPINTKSTKKGIINDIKKKYPDFDNILTEVDPKLKDADKKKEFLNKLTNKETKEEIKEGKKEEVKQTEEEVTNDFIKKHPDLKQKGKDENENKNESTPLKSDKKNLKIDPELKDSLSGLLPPVSTEKVNLPPVKIPPSKIPVLKRSLPLPNIEAFDIPTPNVNKINNDFNKAKKEKYKQLQNKLETLRDVNLENGKDLNEIPSFKKSLDLVKQLNENNKTEDEKEDQKRNKYIQLQEKLEELARINLENGVQDLNDLPSFRTSLELVKQLNENLNTGNGNSDGEGLYDYEINKVMNKFKPPGYLGTFSIDELMKVKKLVKPHGRYSFILNLDKSSGPGSHWVSVLLDARKNGSNTVEYYDPLADNPSERFNKDIMKVVQKLQPYQFMQFKINRIQRQKNTTDTCGWHSIKFILDRENGKKFKECTGYNDAIDGEKDIKKFKEKFPDFVNV